MCFKGVSTVIMAVVLVLGIGGTTAYGSTEPDVVTDADALIQQARKDGLDYLNSKDDRTKKSAKKGLDEAEKLLKKALKDDQSCEKCYELLTAAHLYQTYFGFSKDYDDCLKVADSGLARFPSNARMTYLKGYALYNAGRHSESIKYLNQFLSMPVPEETAASVKKILADSQAKFLASWNRHANYYQSKDSKIFGFNQQTGRQEPVFAVTKEWEMNLGSMGFNAIAGQAPKVEDPEVKAYVQKLVDRLVTKSPGSPFEYRLTIVNSPEVNAVTPPGHVIVYTGLLAFAENESELAGVLSHELAHNYAHHQARAVLSKYKNQSIANAIVAAVAPQGGWGQLAAGMGSAFIVELFARSYSRSEEKEADLYGSHIMFNAGYNPTSLSNFFLKMYKANPKQPLKLLSTHPPVPDRTIYLTEYLESFPLDREMQMDSLDFQNMKKRLARLVPMNQPTGAGRGVLPDQ
jgi:predicted Zn-dependent protease